MSKAYYMRDNHTFRLLPESLIECIQVLKEEFDAGEEHGMLCTKLPAMEHKKVHCDGRWREFESAAREWLAEFFSHQGKPMTSNDELKPQ